MTDHSPVLEAIERNQRRRRILIAVIGTLLVLIGTAGATGLWLAAQSLSEVRASSDYLKECTTPSTSTDFHQCYESGQLRTAEAVRALFENQAYNRDLIICVLFVDSEDRNEASKQKCEQQAAKALEKGPP